MKIGIISCETFERNLEPLIKDDPDIVHKEYLEFGLHEYPEELKKAVIDKVNALEGRWTRCCSATAYAIRSRTSRKCLRCPPSSSGGTTASACS